MIYVLIMLMLASEGNGAVATQEFSSQQKCEAARDRLPAKYILAYCVPK